MTHSNLQLFPEIEPYHTGFLKVSDLHTIFYEEVGNPKGKPIVFLHGGPGGGINAKYRRFFDPKFYRVILFDQRGCGKSTPRNELRENTTWDLVEDMEKLRRNCGVERWVVFGGSWGSTLALAYAISHPERTLGMILRGIFLCRRSEIDWFYQEGASQIYPDAWDKYLQPIPEGERGNLVEAYFRRLTGTNLQEQIKAAKAWSIWEASTSRLIPDADAIARFENPDEAITFASIECHYFIHNSFFETDSFLLEKADEISHIPCRIVQGRYDVVCPARSAWDLAKAMPNADLRIVADAGHSPFEPGNARELLIATEDFKNLY